VRFEALYLEHYRSIYGYVLRRVPGSAIECDDLVSDIFAVAWRRLDAVPPAPEERLWLFGVARRRLLELYRSNSSRRRLLSRLTAQPYSEVPAPSLPDPVHAQLHKALDELRPLDRETLLLVVWDGLSHAEAAAVLGCSVNAVALRIRRAKARLRGVLEQPPTPPFRNATPVPSPLKETP
jgi:RNA polymerase sigma-70 factor (ECF subfamily)